jgi:NADH-quinone oxidoreductase subunit J
VGLMAALAWAIRQVPEAQAAMTDAQRASFGTLPELGRILYTTYLLPFEAVSLLLLVAIVGAVVVAKPRI